MSPDNITIHWEGDARAGKARLLDQTRLPDEELWIEVRDLPSMVDAIRRLAVRGAPALGVAGAYGLVLGLQGHLASTPEAFLGHVRAAAAELAAARPTAVNLPAALERSVLRAEREANRAPAAVLEALLAEARALEEAERAACERMGAHGAALLADGMAVITHCNAGALATVGIGTGLAPIYVAARQGKRLRIFSDETRPLLQGARLTAWELARAGLDVTVMVDGAAGHLLQRGGIGAVLVGADRIARNGDVANKIGTYPLAVLARRHGVPFYVIAPLTTFDPRCPSGAAIPIEERPASEVTHPLGVTAAPAGVGAFNPAFDVTPAELVSAIVTERGVIHRPDEARVKAFLEG
ncbi:MAG TPA: S-methyl-5-thioribose-1-phosphate isomerase [Planctomycetota bacterium]